MHPDGEQTPADQAPEGQPEADQAAPASNQGASPAEGDAKAERRSRSRSPSAKGGKERRRRSRSRSRDRKDRKERRRSRSRSRDRRRRRSRSRSRDRRRSPAIERAPVYEIERVRPEDRAPAAMMPMAAPMLPGVGVPGMPNMMGGMAGMAGMAGLANPALAGMAMLGGAGMAAPKPQMPAVNQATRPQRRLYVGGVPPGVYDFQLGTFLNQALMALGICQSVGKTPIINCQVNPERNFAFIEFGDVADATAALQLDMIPFRGQALKIKRPKDYVHPYGAPPDPMPLGPAIMQQLLAANAGGAAPADPAAAAAAAPPLPPAMPGMPAVPGMPAMPGMPPMPPM